MTFIDKDGMTHCMNKNSDKTVEVKCVDDEEKPVTDPPAPPVPGDEGAVLALKIERFGIYYTFKL